MVEIGGVADVCLLTGAGRWRPSVRLHPCHAATLTPGPLSAQCSWLAHMKSASAAVSVSRRPTRHSRPGPIEDTICPSTCVV